MKKVTTVPQQYKDDKANYTGKFGMGFQIEDRKSGRPYATAPTLAQAEAALEAAKAATGNQDLVIEDAGFTDSLYHKADSPFRFKPL